MRSGRSKKEKACKACSLTTNTTYTRPAELIVSDKAGRNNSIASIDHSSRQHAVLFVISLLLRLEKSKYKNMGCGASSPAQAPSGGGGGAPPQAAVAAQAYGDSRTIDSELERMREEEEGKIKMLLLGAGESGKSTIFKQMRLLYGTERSDDDLRMYGVVARSNIVVAVRKLCTHLRNLGLEEELDRESRENEDLEDADHSGFTCRQAYDELMAYLVDNTAIASEMEGGVGTGEKDWVGQSPRAGLAANNDAKQFLAHHESIRILWQVSLKTCLVSILIYPLQ